MGWTADQTYHFTFQTVDSAGAPADADSTPTGTLYVNGSSTAAVVTITDSGTGWYRGSVSLTGRSVGDVFEVEVSATIGGTAYLLGMGSETIDVSVNSITPPTAAAIRTEIDSNSTQLAAIVDDTNELQGNQGNWTTATGFSTLDTGDIDARLAAYDAATKAELDAAIAGLNDLSAAEVNAECDTAISDASLATAAALAAAQNDLDTITDTGVVATNTTAIATAVWASGTRSLTTFGTLIADIWAAATRTLTAGTKDSEIDTIKAVTDKLDDTLEDDGGTQRFTTNALEQAPSGGGGGGDATEAKQDQIIADIAAINTGSGSGARSVTITINDGTNPLENVAVRLTEGVNTFTATTNASGVATFALDDATYTLTATKSGYTLAPASLVVNGTEAETFSMSQVSITPSPAGQSTGYLVCYDQFGQVESGVEITLQLVAVPSGAGLSLDQAARTVTTGADGIAQFAGLFQGAAYNVSRGGSKSGRRQITVPGTSPFEIGNMMGSEA